MNQIKGIKAALNKSIKTVCQSPMDYCRNPKKDFTRRKKLPMDKVIKTILGFSSKSLNNEMIDIFSGNTEMPSASALVQQRSKILPTAFEDIFKEFTTLTNPVKLYDGFRLLAVDGSDIHTPTNPDDPDSCCQVKDHSPYNLYHLNALYDLCSHTYLDAVVQKRKNWNEHRALCNMVDRYDSSLPTIFIADRGYESYNSMAHIQQIGQFFLFRIKDVNSCGMLRGFDLPDEEEFDFSVSLALTNKSSNLAKSLCKDRNRFRYIPPTSTFDFLPSKSRKADPMSFFKLSFRIVRFEIVPDKHVVLATNLPVDSFPTDKLKYLYSLRWGIETSFRSLKYTIGLLYFHSKKPEHIIQEIFAKLTMYNYTELIAASISIRNAARKLIYRINFSAAANVCRKFFLGFCTPNFVEAVIQKNILPIRSLKGKPRLLKSKRAVSFLYRVA